MSRWFRMYDDLLDDPKVQRLPADLFKAWVNLLCLASRYDGKLPSIEDVAFALRIDEAVADQIIGSLVDRGLIDIGDSETATPHNWDKRQFKSDRDNTASERKQRQRDREKNVTVDVTRDITDVSRPPDTEQNRTEELKQDAREDDWSTLETKLRLAAGWQSETHPSLMVVGPVVEAIKAGCDLDLDVLPTIKAKAHKAIRRASWNFFIEDILAARDRRLSAAVPFDPSKPRISNAPDRKQTNTIAAGFDAINAGLAAREAELDALEERVQFGGADAEKLPRLRQITA